MKMWKRISVVVVVLCLALLLPMQVYAEQNSVQDQLRQQIITALTNREDTLDVEAYGMSPDEITAQYKQIMEQEDGLWYAAKYCGYLSYGDVVAQLHFYYYFDAQQTQQIQAVVDKAIGECIHSGMSEAHKALALHDYLVLHCAYDTNYLNYDAYSALVWGSSVCQGYAQAYEILLNAVGIESKMVSSEAMNHAWNLVRIDGQWYHVDVTWDDPLHYSTHQDTPGHVKHSHFLCSDSQIKNLEHYGWETDIACTSTKYDADMFWDDATSAIWFLSDKEVLMRRDSTWTMEVFVKNLQTGNETSLYENLNKYFQHNGNYMAIRNHGLTVDNGIVYFSDLTKIYKLTDLSGTPEVVCTLADLAQGHYIYSSYVDGIVLRAAVVNQDTKKTQIVTKLLDTAHVHTWQEGVVTVEPTENSEGEICYTCSGCGEVRREVLGKTDHVHTYSKCTKMPTCTEKGYSVYTCRCGHSYEGDYVEPLGHQESVKKGVSPTCERAGLTEGKACSRCYEWLVPQETIPALGHNWDPATCTKPKVCTVCNVIDGKPNGHDWAGGTCTTPMTCKVCGVTSGSELGHNWKAATCTTPKTCTVCSVTSGGAGGHSWQAATCVKPKTCTSCGKTTGKPAGHIYSDGVDGTCNVCNIHRETTEKRNVMHMFRMYDPNSGEHFYTGSTVERENLVAAGWHYEGVGFTFSQTTGSPVYRLYDPVYGEHLYTMDVEERDALIAEGWSLEGIAFNSAYDTEVPQYRLHNPNAKRGAYHFTASVEERDFLISLGWEYQGIGFYSSWK